MRLERRRWQATTLALASLAIGVARWLGRARVPDDYDSIGFTRAIERYDLAALRPHFPGYPVYVALAKLAAAAGLAPLTAATLVSAIAGQHSSRWRLQAPSRGALCISQVAGSRAPGSGRNASEAPLPAAQTGGCNLPLDQPCRAVGHW